MAGLRKSGLFPLACNQQAFLLAYSIRAVPVQIRRSTTMFYGIIGLIVLVSIGLAVYALINKSEL